MSRTAPKASLLRLVAAAALGIATVTTSAPAQAAPPVHISFPVDISYQELDLSEACGFFVLVSLEGTFKGTLTVDRSGTITGEFDSQPDTWFELSSPDSGKSIRNPFATRFHNRYPDGADPGDRVVATATGYLEKLPGLGARAGRIVFPDGEVLFVDDGIPYVDYGAPSSEVGHSYSDDEAVPAICAALAPD